MGNCLSPLARGTQIFKLRFCFVGLFIPAGAGNSAAQHCRTWRPACLSPLARGTRTECEAPFLHQLFIPAGAGNSSLMSERTCKAAVYPRWRGELGGRFGAMPPPRCLSPLARGTRDNSKRINGRSLFIPAGAGNSDATH